MTMPMWMAFPPEVHSAALGGGPGSGSLLAAAQVWVSMGTQYAEAAEELTGLVATVGLTSWAGQAGERYIAANAPYAAWLLQEAADAAVTAAQHEAVAGAYAAALATMPSLGELAANHATHAVLVATNFFGINTIPIALNEADYVRMWIQAATTMSAYEAASGAALTATPRGVPAPPIVKADSTATPAGQPGTLEYFLHQLSSYITGNVPGGDGGQNEGLLQFLLGVPPGTNPSSLIATDIAQDLAIIQANIGFAGGNPLLIPLSLFSSALILSFEHVPLQLLQFAIAFPGLTAGLAAPAAGSSAGLGGLAGLSGLSGLGALHTAGPAPVDIEPAPAAPIFPAPIAAVPASAAAAAPAPVPPSAAAAAPPPSPPPPAPPPSAPPPPPSAPGLGPFPYLVAGMPGQGARAPSRARARRTTPSTAAVVVPAAAVRGGKQARRRRRRRTRMRGYGHEYMEMNIPVEPDWAGPTGPEPGTAIAASARGSGALGVTGTVRAGAVHVDGLTALVDGEYGSGPTEPMLPHTWTGQSSHDRPTGPADPRSGDED